MAEQKQRPSVYTMMLILAFIAVSIGCLLLWLELDRFAPYPWWKTDGVVPATSQLVPLTDPLPKALV